MCGICGGVGLAESTVGRMVHALQHRGPDDEGTFAAGVVQLGARRLAVIDLAHGNQPLHNEDRTIALVCNGEIYNYHELRQRLTELGHRFHTGTDAESVIHAYEEWGRACVDQLRGMFAFALYDGRNTATPTLFLARDRLGIKPLYYYSADGTLLFASEVRTLLASRVVPRTLDHVALWQYLGYQSVPGSRTLIEGVRLLPPGHWLEVDVRGVATEGCYWDLAEQSQPASGSVRQTVRQLLEHSVALHLVSDVPVGVFLSGGVDSSSLVALVRAVGQVPTTFTVGFPDSDAMLDERRYARVVADHFRTDHTELSLVEEDVLDQVPDALAAFDHPTGDGVNTYLIAGAVRRAGFKVALSGLGGDEFFAGYPSFRRLALASRLLRGWGTVPSRIRSVVARTVRSVGAGSVAYAKVAAWLAGDGSLAELYPVTRQVFLSGERTALLTETWRERLLGLSDPCVDLLRETYSRVPDAPLLSRISFAEARIYMHDVLLRDADQMGMAHGLEIRVPLLDHRLVEYLMSLPDGVKHRDGRPKPLLTEALADELPRAISVRSKQGFTLPFGSWLRGPLRAYASERVGPERLGARGMFEPRALMELWDRFLSGHHTGLWSRIWTLVALEEWLERNQVTP